MTLLFYTIFIESNDEAYGDNWLDFIFEPYSGWDLDAKSGKKSGSETF